ncbi:MAG TPA: hypothetical protein VHG09_11950 [Longimicrobiales bacterium]|nr:hypothetical protein [Longimicrobiales bacterium]
MTATPAVLPSTAAFPAGGLPREMWRASPPLTAVGVLMLFVAGLSLVGVFADPRVITGAPAWLKPFKFAVSTAIYSLTLAWIFTNLTDWPRMRRIVGWTTAIVFILEVGLIDIQAWRGTTSHFNVATTFDRVLFGVMGTAIVMQTFVSVAVAVALWRQRFTDRVLGWALRFGMILTIAGAMTGPLMTRPTAEQLAHARAGGAMTIVGSHSVGGGDGGPGVPVTGWSREHGDVRVAHFVGLHALQVLALIALALRGWRRRETVRVRMMVLATVSYATLFLLLLWEALRGRSFVAPDTVALASFAMWAAATAVAIAWIGFLSNGRAGGSNAAEHAPHSMR